MIQTPTPTAVVLSPVDLSVAYRALQRMVEGALALAPRLVVAAIIVLVLYHIGGVLRWAVLRGARRWSEHENVELAIARLVHAAVIGVSVLVAATIAFPSFTAGNLIQLLGVSGIAIGFAFKDIFQNFLAGLLILITEPFTIGDQIAVDAYEGTVEAIHTRATLITTYDHRRIVVPNADLFTKSVTVLTAFPLRRMEYDLVLPGDVDVDATRARLLEVLNRVMGVAHTPGPEVLLMRIDPTTTTLRLRWWGHAEQGAAQATYDRVLTETRRLLRPPAAAPSSAAPAPPRAQGS
ncbi:MAG: mechanosensitive ion channel [Gemmatimonadaceae bacterium]|nr:mechanosensitive ion channel [Gemmatimonadaceae bacterium]